MNAFADRVKGLQDKFDEPLPESWIPEAAGEAIAGTFVRLEKGETALGPSWIVVLDTGDGVFKSVWLYHTSLANEFKRARPTSGELVAIRYNGKRPVKNPTKGRNKEYHEYKVVVDREHSAAPPQWDLLDREATVSEPEPVEAAAAPPLVDDSIPF